MTPLIHSSIVIMVVRAIMVWVTKTFLFSVKQRLCNGILAFCVCTHSVLHILIFFYCMGIIILPTCTGEKTGRKNVIRMHVKQEPERYSSVKNYPSVKTQMVFSDYASAVFW